MYEDDISYRYQYEINQNKSISASLEISNNPIYTSLSAEDTVSMTSFSSNHFPP